MAATGVAAEAEVAVAGMPAPTVRWARGKPGGVGVRACRSGSDSPFSLWELPWPGSRLKPRWQSPACRLPQ